MHWHDAAALINTVEGTLVLTSHSSAGQIHAKGFPSHSLELLSTNRSCCSLTWFPLLAHSSWFTSTLHSFQAGRHWCCFIFQSFFLFFFPQQKYDFYIFPHGGADDHLLQLFKNHEVAIATACQMFISSYRVKSVHPRFTHEPLFMTPQTAQKEAQLRYVQLNVSLFHVAAASQF